MGAADLTSLLEPSRSFHSHGPGCALFPLGQQCPAPLSLPTVQRLLGPQTHPASPPLPTPAALPLPPPRNAQGSPRSQLSGLLFGQCLIFHGSHCQLMGPFRGHQPQLGARDQECCILRDAGWPSHLQGPSQGDKSAGVLQGSPSSSLFLRASTCGLAPM